MNIDARTFLKKSTKTKQFVTAAELRSNGPLLFTVSSVEVADGFADRGGSAQREIVLLSTSARKFSLRTETNLKMMLALFGDYSNGWIGKSFVLYCDPTVTNPSGVEV